MALRKAPGRKWLRNSTPRCGISETSSRRNWAFRCLTCAGLVAFAGGVLRPGVDIVADACKLTSRIAGAELVITGEGRIDAQTPHGKTPAGVAKAARQLGIPVVAIAGSLGPGYDAVHDCGIREVISIQSGTMSLAEAMARAPELLAAAAERVARAWADTRRGFRQM